VPLVLLVPGDAQLAAALRRGLPAGTRVRRCAGPDAAEGVLRRELVDAVVVGACGDGWVRTVARFRARYPGIPVFGSAAFRPGDGGPLLEAVRGGLDGVLVSGVDEPVAGELVAARAASRARFGELADAPRLLRLTERVQQRGWAEVLRRAGGHTTTAVIARAVGTSREHLSREFAAGGAPNLKRVIDLVRIASAADLLRNPGYDVATVVRILRFASRAHLVRTARRVAGAPPDELPRLGPRGVLQRFLRGRTRSRI
jgi:AraC-like DNA-binding protein